jgi:membrane-associated phospholipid phosphatase
MPARAINPLKLAGACAVAFALLLMLAYAPGPARWLDGTALQQLATMQHTSVSALADRLVAIGDPAEVGLIGIALALIAVARGRPRLALGVFVLLAATSVGSQILKALLAHPRPGHPTAAGPVGPEAFPSGHATAAMSLALAAVIVAPRRLRPLVAAVGGVAALAVGVSVVVIGWHFPSDVVGGYLLAAGTSLGVVAAVRAADARWPARHGRRLVSGAVARVAELGMGAATALGAAVVALFALAAITRLPQLAEFASQHKAVVLVVPAMAAAGVALIAAVTATLSRRV